MKNLSVSQKWDYKFNDFGTLKKHEKTRTELLGIARNEGENETALTDKPFNCAKCDEEFAKNKKLNLSEANSHFTKKPQGISYPNYGFSWGSHVLGHFY